MLKKKYVIKKTCMDTLGNTISLYEPTDIYGQKIFPDGGFNSLQNAENALYQYLNANIETNIEGKPMAVPPEYVIDTMYGFDPESL